MKAIPRASEMAVGQIEAIAEDGHLMRVDEDSWEYAEDAFATAYLMDETEVQAVLDGDKAERTDGRR